MGGAAAKQVVPDPAPGQPDGQGSSSPSRPSRKKNFLQKAGSAGSAGRAALALSFGSSGSGSSLKEFRSFVSKGGAQSAFNELKVYFQREAAGQGRFIENVEDRAMSLQELRNIVELINTSCKSALWRDTTSNAVLSAEEVNLYHMNYHHICPATLPEGVVLKGLLRGKVRPRRGESVQQRDPASGRVVAEGFVRTTSISGGDVMVTVTRGRFASKFSTEGVPWRVEISGRDAGGPDEVQQPKAVSYKELISPKPLQPLFFVSHWWGEPHLHFVACCEEHARLRDLGDKEASFWICAYANRQHDLGGEISDNPDETSFRRAMKVARGVLLILDEKAMPFRRMWCCFELYRTVATDKKLMDIITYHHGTPQLLADGQLPGEELWEKRRRELQFPIHLLTQGLRCKLEEGKATMNIDRVHILNVMTGRIKALNDVAILTRLVEDRAVYSKANNALRARFAIAAWPVALKQGLVMDFDDQHPGSLSLPEVLKSSDDFANVVLDLRNFDEQLDDGALKAIADGLPTGLQHLTLYCSNCTQLTDASVRSLAQAIAPSVSELSLRFGPCENLSDDAVQALARKLPPGLTSLELSFGRCAKVTDAGLSAVARKLPGDLSRLVLDFRSCPQVTDFGLEVLAENFPRAVKTCDLQFRDCPHVCRTQVRDLLKKVPPDATTFAAQFRGTGAGRSFHGLDDLREWLAVVA